MTTSSNKSLFIYLFISVIVLATINNSTSCYITEDEYQLTFLGWMTTYNKSYGHQEFSSRFNTFKSNLDRIHEFNNQNGTLLEGVRSMELGLNQFSDLTFDEFKSIYLIKDNITDNASSYSDSDSDSNDHNHHNNGHHYGHNHPSNHGKGRKGKDQQQNQNQPLPFQGHGNTRTTLTLPIFVDWRTEGYVTSVKDQGDCGSCYAFSALSALESVYKKNYGSLLDLSEQQIIDCSYAQGNSGCNGGWMDYVYDYIVSNGGVSSERDYPYYGYPGVCYGNHPKVASIHGWTYVQPDEASLKEAISVGPVAAAVAVNSNFMSYRSGIYDDPTCSQTVNHAITIVGYGTDLVSGKDYWIVKNSWGTYWGENGYIRMVRNKGNQCGIALKGVYPRLQ